MTIHVYLWKPSTYEAVLREAGFERVTWHSWQVSREGIDAYGADYWRPFAR